MSSIIGTATSKRVAVVIVPSHSVDVVAAGVFIAHAAVAAASGIFPLGLGGQAEVLARQLIQPRDKRLTIVPRDALHGALQVAREITWVAAHHGLPQGLGHLGLPNAVT